MLERRSIMPEQRPDAAKNKQILKKIKYPGAEGSEDLDKKQRRGVGTPSVRTGMDASRDMLGKVQEAVWLAQAGLSMVSQITYANVQLEKQQSIIL